MPPLLNGELGVVPIGEIKLPTLPRVAPLRVIPVVLGVVGRVAQADPEAIGLVAHDHTEVGSNYGLLAPLPASMVG